MLVNDSYILHILGEHRPSKTPFLKILIPDSQSENF